MMMRETVALRLGKTQKICKLQCPANSEEFRDLLASLQPPLQAARLLPVAGYLAGQGQQGLTIISQYVCQRQTIAISAFHSGSVEVNNRCSGRIKSDLSGLCIWPA